MLGAEVRKRRFGVGEFHRMAEAGIFGEDDRVELETALRRLSILGRPGPLRRAARWS